MSQAAGAALRAEDLPAGADAASGEPGLAAMFADYDQHGFHGGNSLVLQAILLRPPRTVGDYITELSGP